MVQLFQQLSGDYMCKVRHILWLIFVFCIPCISSADSVCPIELELAKLHDLPKGDSPWIKSSRLGSIKFYAGHPKDLGLLRVDDDMSDQDGNTLRVRLNKQYEYWVLCNYPAFDFSIVKALGEVSSCAITYNKDKVENFECSK